MSAYPQRPAHEDEQPVCMGIDEIVYHAGRNRIDELSMRALEFLGRDMPKQPAAILHEIHANRRLMARREKDRERQRRHRAKKKISGGRKKWYSR